MARHRALWMDGCIPCCLMARHIGRRPRECIAQRRMSTVAGDARRALPGVDQLLQAQPIATLRPTWPHKVLADLARKVLAQERERLSHADRAATARDPDALAQEVVSLVARELQPTLHPVLNATGVILHTNLGRSPLSTAALAAVTEVAEGYTN